MFIIRKRMFVARARIRISRFCVYWLMIARISCILCVLADAMRCAQFNANIAKYAYSPVCNKRLLR